MLLFQKPICVFFCVDLRQTIFLPVRSKVNVSVMTDDRSFVRKLHSEPMKSKVTNTQRKLTVREKRKFTNMAGNDEVCKLAYDGQLEILKMKIRENNELATRVDETNRTPLHWAASAGHTPIIEYLLKQNVPVDARDESNWTALMIAASAGRDQIVSVLLAAGAQANAVNKTGQCSLHYAASKNRYEIAEMLLQYGADPNTADQYLHTPLHRAASKGHVKLTKLLLQYIVDVNARDSEGNTPLHMACEEERTEVCLLMVGHGAKIELLNKEEKSPLDLAKPGLRRSLQAACQT